MVTLTEAAADRVRDFLAKRGFGEGLRFGVKPSGCSGYSYVVNYADEIGPEDLVFETHGVKVIVDRGSADIVEGTQIDFVKDGLNESLAGLNFYRSSPGCASNLRRSTLLRDSRGGVPVLKRPIRKPRAARAADSALAGASPTRPPGARLVPTWSRPRRNVPVVTTTRSPAISRPSESRTPRTRPAAISKPATSPSIDVSPGADRTSSSIAAW